MAKDSNKNSSQWIAVRDAKNAADALKHLRRAAANVSRILSNAPDLKNASDNIEDAISEMEKYKPFIDVSPQS